MYLIGNTDSSAATGYSDMTEDTLVAVEATPDAPMTLAKLSVLADGLGAASGEQPLKGVVYVDGDLVATGEEVIVNDGQEAQWLDLNFTTPPRVEAGALVTFGALMGSPDAVGRYARSGGSGKKYTDSYADGPEPSLSGPSTVSEPLIFATYLPDLTFPDAEDEWLARLPFADAQSQLALDGPDRRSARYSDCGWHGTWLDPEPQGASFAIVQEGSDLEDLVGDRIKITAGSRSVYAYVHRAADLDVDDAFPLSITRRCFMELDVLSTYSLSVKVETLGQFQP